MQNLPAIQINQLEKRFARSETIAVKRIDLEICRGEKFGIFGPNGAGKTTLISMLCGIVQPTRGEVNYQLNGSSLTPKNTLSYIGYVPQDFAFFSELTPVQNLKYFGKLYGIKSQKLTEKIDLVLKRLGLEQFKHKKIASFSGGMKRRVNLAIGLLHDPQFLFLDEPTVGVDIQSKLVIMELLNELNANGTTIIYTSHHLKEAEDFCNRIALIDKGEVIGLGTLEELKVRYHANDLEDLMIQLTGNQLRDS
ncbi:MAG TPA: ABC transporter ATP-binding protein [Taishania sp.]|nr:ABC transporter ATP-binding protein [Taishania sp.]